MILRGTTEASGARGDAGLIPDAYIDELVARVDIAAVVRRGGTELKPSGSGGNLVGRCPFHNEKSPSFFVTPSKGMYHCFGCGASGTALTFLLENEGAPFREAVRELAALAGIPLPAQMQSATAKGAAAAAAPPPDYTRLYAANELALRYFRHVLRNTPAALDYLRSRHIKPETANRFKLAAAPAAWQGLREAFADYDGNASLLELGLVREKIDESTGEVQRRYDTFRDRLMFPISDARGRIIGFGGRLMGPGEPKYLNSPASALFDKSSVLYGLHEAKAAIRRDRFAVVVEGYMDAVMLSQNGIDNVVGSLGTAFSRVQIERLFSLTPNIVFCFDGDAAGITAAKRSCDTVLPVLEPAHEVRFAILPDGLDPDEFVIQHGADRLLTLMREAPAPLAFLRWYATRQFTDKTPEARARIEAMLAQSVRTMKPGPLRDEYLRSITPAGAKPSLHTHATARRADVSRGSWSQPGGPNAPVWQQMAEMARLAPATCIAQRDSIIECLDPNDAGESALIRTLRSIEPAREGASDNAAASELLGRALDIIISVRQKQQHEALKARLESGELTAEDYLREAGLGA